MQSPISLSLLGKEGCLLPLHFTDRSRSRDCLTHSVNEDDGASLVNTRGTARPLLHFDVPRFEVRAWQCMKAGKLTRQAVLEAVTVCSLI